MSVIWGTILSSVTHLLLFDWHSWTCMLPQEARNCYPHQELCKKALFQQDASSKPVPYVPLLFSYGQVNLLTLPWARPSFPFLAALVLPIQSITWALRSLLSAGMAHSWYHQQHLSSVVHLSPSGICLCLPPAPVPLLILTSCTSEQTNHEALVWRSRFKGANVG